MDALRVIAVAVMFAVFSRPGGAQDVSGGDRFGLGFDLAANSRCSLWFTGDDDNDNPLKGNAIDYDTNPIFTWTVNAALTWRQGRLIGVSVQRPFEALPDRDVLVKVLTPTMSIEDYTAFLQMPFLRSLGDRKFLSRVSGLRLEHWRHVFYGSGSAVEQSIFAGGDSDRVLLNPGDTIQFTADFRDWNLSLPAFTDERGVEYRLGVYRSVIHKPHETILSVSAAGGYGPLIVETVMTSWGGLFAIDSIPLDLVLRMGAVRFDPQGNVEEFGLFESTGSFDSILHLGLTPRIRIGARRDKKRDRGLFVTPIMNVDLRWDSLKSDTSGLGIDDFELSGDLLIDGGLRIEWVY